MKVSIREDENENEVKELAFDIDFALEGYTPELGVHVLSLTLARYIMKSDYPVMAYSHSKNVLNNSFTILKEALNAYAPQPS